MFQTQTPHRGSMAACALLIGLFAAGLQSAAATAEPQNTVAEPPPPLIEPLILFENDTLVTCGLRATFTTSGGPLSTDITLHRTGESAAWIVSVAGAAFPKDGPPPSDLGVKTESIDTRTSFSKPKASASGGFEVRGALDASAGATFIREVLIQGATIGVTAASGTSQQFLLTGPLPPAVRSGYLMCAGDLFR